MMRYEPNNDGSMGFEDGGEWVHWEEAEQYKLIVQRLAEWPTKTEMEILVEHAQALVKGE